MLHGLGFRGLWVYGLGFGAPHEGDLKVRGDLEV